MKKLVECGYSVFTTVKRELCALSKKVRDIALDFGTEDKPTAESSDLEETNDIHDA